MLKMRLQRTGRKNDASFRVIVTDSRRGPKSGNNVDLLGSYNPKMNRFEIDADKAKAWIAQGVQVSDTLHNLLVNQKIIEGTKKNVLPRKSPIIDEAKVKAEAEAAEAKKVVEEAAKADAAAAAPVAEALSEVQTEESATAEEPVPEAAPETLAPEAK